MEFQMIHQLRIYEIFEHNKAAFHERFQKHAARIMSKYGFQILYMWEAKTETATEFVYLLEWPQSKERIRGAENFARMNAEYPAHGRWQFQINRLFGTESEVVSEVTVSDGVQHARAISFFSVSNGKIMRLVEFWPDDYEAPAHRSHLVERILDEAPTH